MFDDEHTGFQPNYLPVSPSALPAVYPRVPYGFRHFPASYFPTYYPAYYQGKSCRLNNLKTLFLIFAFFTFLPSNATADTYGFGDNYEIKSDAEDLQDALDDDLRGGSTAPSSTSGSGTKPSTTTNPLAPVFNTLIAINNMKILKLLLANKAMLILG